MVSIDNYFEKIPLEMTEETYKNQLKTLLDKIKSGVKINTTNDIKRYAPIEVKKALLVIFNGKCAYCECKSSSAPLDTDHFRPKSIYMWLAYEWSNFLLVCKRCNTGKLAKFGITGLRAEIPDLGLNLDAFIHKCNILEYVHENHEFLHPVLDEPSEYLEFKENGKVYAKFRRDKSNRGQYSIDNYKLNRDEDYVGDLVGDRKKIVETVRLRIERAVKSYTKYGNEKELYDTIQDIHLDLWLSIEKEEEYCAMRESCVENFKKFFIDKFKGDEEEILNKVYARLTSLYA